MKRTLIVLFGIAILATSSGVSARSNGQAESLPALSAEDLRRARWAFEPVEFVEQSSRLSRRDRPRLRGILNYMYRVPELGLILVPRGDSLARIIHEGRLASLVDVYKRQSMCRTWTGRD